MRKIESVAAIALAVLMTFSAVCMAEAPESDGATKTAVVDGATYNLLDTMDATYVSCPSGSEIVVPSSVTYSGKTYTVTTIGSNAFKSNKSITSVVLPGTVGGLPTSCFSGCSSLDSIVLGGVTAIPSSCFTGTAFSSISMEGVVSVGASAFKSCSSLTFVSMPDVMAVGSNAFQNSEALSTVLMPAVRTVDSQAFSGCASLESVSMPSVQTIGSKAFSGCSSLHAFEFGSLEAIKSEAFSGCSSMTAFDLAGVRGIDYSAFSGTSIPDPMYLRNTLIYVPATYTHYEFPSSVSVIGGGAFENVVMDEIVVPEWVGNIHDKGFMNSKISKVVLSDSLVAIGSGAFQNSGITSIVIPSSIDFLANQTFLNCRLLTEVTIPASVEQVGDEVFKGCIALESVRIPDTVTVLGAKMFSGCTSLVEVSCSGVEMYGDECFYGCSSLESFSINPGSVMGAKMFQGCASLARVTLPDRLEAVSGNAFSNCTSLTSIDLSGVQSISGQAFSGSGLTQLTLPASMPYDALKAYSLSGAKNLVKVVVESPYMVIPNQCFNGCVNLKTLEVTGTVSIASSAFIKCSALDQFIVHSAVPFDAVDGFSSTPLNSLVKADSVNSCKYVDVVHRTVDGDSDSRVVISPASSTQTVLTIDEGYCGASLSAISGVLSKASSSFVSSNPVFELEGGAMYVGDRMVFSKPSSGTVAVRDGTVTISPRALDGFSAASTLVIPASVAVVLPMAVSKPSQVGLSEIFLYSSPSVFRDAFMMPETTETYYLYGTYDPTLSANLPMSGQFVDIGDSRVMFNINLPTACELLFVSDDDTVAFSMEPNEGYDRSVPSVFVGGASVGKAPEGTFVGNVEVSGMYLVDGISADMTVRIEGYAINHYEIDAPSGDGFVFKASASDVVTHGQEVAFSVMLLPGYGFADGFVATANGLPLDPYLASDDYLLYRMAVFDDVVIALDGIKVNDAVRVVFDSAGGSNVESQDVVIGTPASRPADPVRSGYLFGGWYEPGSDAPYGFGIVEDSLELVARWLSSSCHAVSFTVSGGHVEAYVNGGHEPVPSGSLVPDGSFIRFVYVPDFGYEPLSWKINGVEAQVRGWTLEVPEAVFDVRLHLETAYHSSGSSVVSVPLPAPTPDDYVSAWTYGDGGDPNNMTFTNMVYAPSMIGDYIYCKNDNYLVKIDYDGNEVKRVKTADSFSGFYEYLTVGGGLILDSITGKVYDSDLNHLFTIGVTSARTFYNDGYFFVSKASTTYCYSADDERPDLSGDLQQPLWAASLGSAVTPYQGGTNMAFHNDVVMVVGMDDSGAVFLATYKYASGEPVDRLYIDEFQGMMVNIGYTFIGEGYATLTVYEGGLFGSTDEDIVNLASVRIMEDGRFDKATLKTASSHTGGTHSSTMAVHDGLGYVFSNDQFQVYDVSTMELLASAREDTFYAHGDMAISTGHPGKVYAYRASYNDTSHIAVAEYDIASNKVSVGFLSEVSLQQYCSQQPRFLSDGSIVFVNDAGLLYCVKSARGVESVSMDIAQADLDVGEEMRLSVVFDPSNASCKNPIWSSSDTSVATVSENGTVSAVGAGSAVISASVEDGEFVATCVISVYGLANGSVIVQDGVKYRVTDLAGQKVSAVGYEEAPEDLVIPAYVVEGGHAFMVTGIGLKAFARCQEIKTLVTYVDPGQYAFYGCTGLTSATLAEGVVSIQKSAFSECRALVAVTFPDTLESIEENAFYKCVSLKSVEFPESLKTVGMKSFAYCSSVSSLTIASDVGGYAFYKCTGLKTLRVEGESVDLGKSAFSGCSGLRNVYVSDGVESIGVNAFYGCSFYVLGMKVGATAENLAGHKFLGTASRLNAYVPGVGGSFASDGVKYAVTSNEGPMTVAVKGASSKDVRIPESVRYLGFEWDVTEVLPKAFYGNGSLETVSISGDLHIGSKAFAGCGGLRSVSASGQVSMGAYAFAGCTGLENLDLSTVRTISVSAFSGCTGLSEVSFSEDLSDVGTNAFYKVQFREGGQVLPATASDLAGKTFRGSGGVLNRV